MPMVSWAALIVVGLAAVAGAGEPVRVIFDTDIMGDVDDVGAVAVLHALAAKGEAKVLAMGVSAKNPHCVPCLDALNTYFGRPDVPIGVVKGKGFKKRSRYSQQIAAEFPHDLNSAADAPDAAALYRKTLAAQPDGSVVVISVGQLTNFRNLLKTDGGEHSTLAGPELVRRKVKLWVCMGGKFPAGREANLIHDGPAAAYAIAHWPTPIVFSGWEIGVEVLTGGRLAELPESSPVRRAYQLYNGLKPHKSWDQTAVLYAVRGTRGGLEAVWDLHREGRCHVFPDGRNAWRPEPDRPHAYLVEKMPPAQVARRIEALMLYQPTKLGEPQP
ncbi:MAG: nucleoside hydrolase [Planctomycetota bacterium]